MSGPNLTSISDIRRHFQRNDRPIYFVSGTNYNLLGLDEWVRGFSFISYIDCYDGRHPNSLTPPEREHDVFESIIDINNYLLRHPDVREHIKLRGGDPVFVFLMFDEETEKLVEEIGGELWFPKASMRESCDDKLKTVRIGNDAGVPSVPNALGKVESYEDLRKLADENDLGEDLVVQAAFGDSGDTTYFIASEEDFDEVKDGIVDEPEVKVMKRIDCRGSAIEAVTTASGTIVGPLMTELVGFPSLTPNEGGWCGNEIFADAFGDEVRQKARDLTFKFGEQLREEGYRGYFELDFLIDKDTGDVWLGELNPRVAGTTSLVNSAAFSHADMPLFLFHLLEFSDATFDIDVDDLNKRWSDPAYIDDWSQMVLKYTKDDTDMLTAAPYTGIYRMQSDGKVVYDRFDYHRRAVKDESEAFFLRILKAGDHRYEGADMGILVVRGRLMTDDFELNERAEAWADAMGGMFVAGGGAAKSAGATGSPPQAAMTPRFKLG